MASQPTQQPANAHRLRVGDFIVITLMDAYMQGAFELLQNIDEAEARRMHAQSRRPTPPRITLNVYLVDTGDQKILIDTSLGPVGGSTGRRLLDSLKAASCTPDDIDTVLITRVPLPGHTPDHSGYRVESDGDSLLIWGDIVHLPHIQLARPEAGVIFDTDPALASRTRRDILAEVAESREMIVGHHIDFPAIGYVVEDGDGYRFSPHVWDPSV